MHPHAFNLSCERTYPHRAGDWISPEDYLEEIQKVRKIAEIIEKLGIKVGVYKLKRSKGKLKEYQICITNRRDSEKFLKMILPYLVLKKNYVEEALREFNAYKMSVKRKPV